MTVRILGVIVAVAIAGCRVSSALVTEDPRTLTLEGLAADLAHRALKGDDLAQLWAQWGVEADHAYVDLNGDQVAELVVVPSFLPKGGLIVLHRKDGRWAADWAKPHTEGPASLVSITDLTGDGKDEIVWQTTTAGAHTGFAWVHASSWAPGLITLLPGTPVTIATPTHVSARGDTLVLEGGLITSAGAGLAQRNRTDLYRWDGSQIALVSRRFVLSPYGYHKLQDGIMAEQYGRRSDARQAYTEAMEPDRSALSPEMLSPDGQPNPDFDQAVHTFARFRLGLLLWRQGDAEAARRLLRSERGPFRGLTEALAGAEEPEAGCRAAAVWATSTPAFLEALNAPYGYANPRWDSLTLCTGLPEFS